MKTDSSSNDVSLIKFIKGQQNIALILNIVPIAGIILDMFSYYHTYSKVHILIQVLTFVILSGVFIFYFIDKSKFYKYVDLVVPYSVIINVIVTAMVFPYLEMTDPSSQSSFFSRDVLFIMCFISFAGFLGGKIHIVIQGILLAFYISYEVFVVKDRFVIESASLYYLMAFGFCGVMYFIVNHLNNILVNLNEANKNVSALKLTESKKNENLTKYNRAIISLSKNSKITENSKSNSIKVFEETLQTVAQNLNCNRASIWLFSDQKDFIYKKSLIENDMIDNTYVELHKKDYPKYFESLVHDSFIAADEARSHESTREFKEFYLEPLNIYSMLDCPIILDNEVVGVICCENQHQIKYWQQEDILFVQSISDFIALNLKNIEIHSLMLNVSEKNKSVFDSINYAKKLQSSILPSSGFIEKYLKDFFVIYKPKDIVSGDFYWMEIVDGQIVFALADCTGHGVPGAILSVMCHDVLNKVVKDHQILNPGEILDKTRELIIKKFEKGGEEVTDGMDISILVYNPTSNTVKWAGANSPLLVCSNGKVEKLSPDKQAVGNTNISHQFKTQKIEVAPGDSIYLYTDGFIDQFGGTSQKKIKYKGLHQLIEKNYFKSMVAQKEIFDNFFKNWIGDNAQIDDVSLIGFKI